MTLRFSSIITICSLIIVLNSCKKSEPEALIDARDGRSYKITKIGSQYWMAENLAYIPFVVPASHDSGIYVYDYNGELISEAIQTKNYSEYGCLYNWVTAMNINKEFLNANYTGTDVMVQGICPEGWHLPSDNEWQILEQHLETNPYFIKETERRFTGDVGLKLKSSDLWFENGIGNNSSGFNAKPSGFRYLTGNFAKQEKYGYFWTATQYWNNSAYYRYLLYSSDGTYRGYPSKKNGIAIRCVKN